MADALAEMDRLRQAAEASPAGMFDKVRVDRLLHDAMDNIREQIQETSKRITRLGE